jgi:hypothetical protein
MPTYLQNEAGAAFDSARPHRASPMQRNGDEEDMPLESVSKYNFPEEIGAALRRAMEKCIP